MNIIGKLTCSNSGLIGIAEIQVSALRLGYKTLKHSGGICNNMMVNDNLDFGSPVDLYAPPSAEELRLQEEEDKQLRKDLLKHLNNNLEYYHKIIWWNMDTDRRYMMLDGFIAPNAQGRSVASVVENKLIGIVGNCLVMPVVRGTQLDPTYAIDPNNPATLLEHYRPTTPLAPYRISVPTRGVFAEAVQGACNSCEKIDDTRYWKWEEHPIPDNPTVINPISTPTPVVNTPDLTAKDFASPIINIQNAPIAPDPQGFAALSALLANPNFKDITGLDQNQQNALQAYLKAQDTALGFGQGAASLAQATAGYDLAKQQQMMKNKDQIMDMINKSDLSKDDKAAYTKKFFDGLIGGGGEKNPAGELSQEAMNKGNLNELEYQGKDGSVKMKMGDAPKNLLKALPELMQLAEENPELTDKFKEILENAGIEIPDGLLAGDSEALINALADAAEAEANNS